MSTLYLCALLLGAGPADADPGEPEEAESPAAEMTAEPSAEPSVEPSVEDEEATTAAMRVVVPDLEARGVETDLAANLTNVVLTRLGQLPNLEIVASRDLARLLDQEQRRQLVGCGEDAACLAELAGALDAPRLLTGTIGKIGERFLLSLALLDTSNARLIRRVTREALVADSLVTAANEATVALWSTGEVEAERCVDCEAGLSKRWVAAIKVGNNFSTFFKDSLDVKTLALGIDIDIGYRVWSSVALFGSVGMRLNSVKLETAAGGTVGMQVLPLQAGVRYHTGQLVGGLSAYVAAGIGLGFLRTKLGDNDNLLTAFTARFYGGLVYALGTRVGALLEISYELTAKRSEDLDASRLDAAALRLGLSYGF